LATPPVIDLAALLAPVSEDAPAGPNLRSVDDGAEYFRLKGLRDDARDLDKQEERGESSDPGAARRAWELLAAETRGALEGKSKDLELVAWMIEGLVREHGFAGLRDGFKAAHGIATTFWESLHYIREDDLADAEPTAKGQAIAGLNGEGVDGTLMAPLRKLAITPNIHPGPFAFWQADAALKKQDLTEIEANAREADRRFYPALLSDIAEAKAAITELTEALRERMGSANMPPTSQLRDALDAIAEMVRRIAGPLAEEPVDGGAATAATDAPGDGGAPAAAGRGGTARPGTFETREQAFAMLLAVAKFFRDREPHSPLSYTLEEAVRRGRLPLPELLSELLGDDETRNRLLTAAGIKPPPPPASE
jgi:type VI secretion system protein ImpA